MNRGRSDKADRADIAVTLLLAAVASVILWQAREFTAFASIFPRAVGSALLLCCALLLARIWRQRAGAWVAPAASGGVDARGLLRSAALVLTLVVWVAMLETAGFALASWVGFFVLALVADREAPKPKRALGYALTALACVLLLQLLFQRGLDVRLPAGVWLPGLFK